MKKINKLISNVLNSVVENWYSILGSLFFIGAIFAGVNGKYLAWVVMLGFGSILSAAGLIISKLNFIEETQDREISRNIQKEWQQWQKELNKIKTV